MWRADTFYLQAKTTTKSIWKIEIHTKLVKIYKKLRQILVFVVKKVYNTSTFDK